MFVGHSFSPDDLKLAELVKAALRRWGVNVVTGERSEARRISEKVKDRIKTSDAFIAIFTRRHPIAKTGKWTTSPWVVDEKGFALGHDRPVIVLLEDQVSWLDETGGLQGDIEYLPFTRKDVSKALRKLKEIVKDLHLPLRPPKKASQPSAEKLPRDWSKKKGAKLFNGASTASWNSDEEGYWGVRNKMLVGSNEGKWSRLHTKRFWAGSVALRVRFRLLKGDAFQLRLNASDDDAANEAILTTWGVFLANGSGSGDSLAAAKTIKLRHGRWMEAVFVNDNGNGMLFLDGRLALEVLGKFTMNKGPIGLGVEKGDVEVRSIELFRP